VLAFGAAASAPCPILHDSASIIAPSARDSQGASAEAFEISASCNFCDPQTHFCRFLWTYGLCRVIIIPTGRYDYIGCRGRGVVASPK
jgi:hypothetical protein